MMYLEFNNRDHLDEYLVNNRGEMYDTIWKSIESAVMLGEDKANIVEIYLTQEQVCIDMVSEADDWLHSLELATTYYAEKEQYETCRDIKLLVEKIKRDYDIDTE